MHTLVPDFQPQNCEHKSCFHPLAGNLLRPIRSKKLANHLLCIFLGEAPLPSFPTGSGGTNAMPMTSGWTHDPGLGNQRGLGCGQEQ